jgi:hypothetical protein
MRYEHLITILSNAAGRKRRKKRPAQSPQGKRPLARRRPLYIRLYDLGYRRSGATYAEIPFTDPNLSDPVIFDANDSGFPWSPKPVTTHFDLLQAEVFTVPVSEWTRNYRRIDADYTENLGVGAGQFNITYRGHTYGLTPDTDENIWNNGVFAPDLEPTSETFAVQPGAGGGMFFRTISNGIGYKWTTELDYDADAVTFTPAPNMDVFLMPSLTNSMHDAQINSTPQVWQSMGFHYAIFPRETQIDPASDHYSVSRIDNTFYANAEWDASVGGTQANIDEYTVVHRASEMYRERFGSFAVQAEWNNFLGEWENVTIIPVDDFMGAGSFPDPPTLPSGDPAAAFWNPGGAFPPFGALLGVVRKGGRTFYCWQDS